MTRAQIEQLNPLYLAYIGDSVYALKVKLKTLDTGKSLQAVHRLTTGFVNAASQAEALANLHPYLSPEEGEWVRRGKNARSHHPLPKSASSAQYSAATGFETLLGFLYLTGAEGRIDELLETHLFMALNQSKKESNAI